MQIVRECEIERDREEEVSGREYKGDTGDTSRAAIREKVLCVCVCVCVEKYVHACERHA